MRDTKPRRTLLSLSIVELMMAGVKTAIVHHSPSSAPTPAKGGPANQAAPPRDWDSSGRRGSGMERSVSRRGGRGARGSSGAQVPTGVSVCAPPAGCPPRGHRGHQGLMALDTRCRVEGRKGSPGGWWSPRSDRGLTWPPWPPRDAPEGFRRRRHGPARGGGGRAASRVCGAARRGRALSTGVRGTEARAPVLAQNLRSPGGEGAAAGGPEGHGRKAGPPERGACRDLRLTAACLGAVGAQ